MKRIHPTVLATVLATVVALTLILASCAGQPDRFYTLSALPDAPRAAGATPAIHVILTVTIPASVDRREIVINTSRTQVLILEHERWAAPLAEEVSESLARDIERRRGDVLVGDRGFDQSKTTPVRIKVDVVQMSAQKGASAVIEAHWRIADATAHVDEIGADVFTAPLDGEDYAAVARSFSTCLSALADRLAAKIAAAH